MLRNLTDALVLVSTLGLGLALSSATAQATPDTHPVPRVAGDASRSVVVDDPSIVGGRPVRFDGWSPGGSPEVISLQFQLASPGCGGVHARVQETDDAVTVELQQGTQPAAVGRMCTMVVVPAALEVTLQSPVGDRTILSTA